MRATLLDKQDGLCPICKQIIVYPALDHCHSTGNVRAVLCSKCNWMEGRIKRASTMAVGPGNELEYIKAIAEYWEHHASNPSNIMYPTHGMKKKRKRKAKQPSTYVVETLEVLRKKPRKRRV